jgi:hypothetical protein
MLNAMLGVTLPFIVLVAAPSSAQITGEVAFRTLARGSDSRIEERRELVARTAGSWQFLWFKHSGGDNRPEVDTPREMVLAVFAGKTADPRRWVEITRVTRAASGFVVRYRVHHAVAALTASAPARPYHIVAVAADRGDVTFIEQRESDQR